MYFVVHLFKFGTMDMIDSIKLQFRQVLPDKSKKVICNLKVSGGTQYESLCVCSIRSLERY